MFFFNPWPKCVKSANAVVTFLPQNRKTGSDLADDLSFEGLNERYVLDLVEANREPLSYEEVIRLQADPKIKTNSKVFPYFEQGINILLEYNPDIKCRVKESRGINSAISCYK